MAASEGSAFQVRSRSWFMMERFEDARSKYLSCRRKEKYTTKPGRRRQRTSNISKLSLVLFVLFTLCLSAAADSPIRGRKRLTGRFYGMDEILIDTRPVPRAVGLERRQGSPFDSTGGAKTKAAKTSSTTKAASKATAAAIRPKFSSTAIAVPSSEIGSPTSGSDAAETSIATAPTQNSPLPKPFDAGLGTNYTSMNCPNFLNSFLQNQTFTSCLPLSMLLQNSGSFFSATGSMADITHTLNATCDVVQQSCSALMTNLASGLRLDANCGDDFQKQNPLVRQAYNGLLAYDALYEAGCKKDDKGRYCFADAVTNTTSPSDSYIYYLPLGVPLPGGSQPTCSKCLQEAMGIFNTAAANKSQPISLDYTNAAQVININCGPNFVNGTIQTKGKGSSAAPPRTPTSLVGVFAAVAAAVVLSS